MGFPGAKEMPAEPRGQVGALLGGVRVGGRTQGPGAASQRTLGASRARCPTVGVSEGGSGGARGFLTPSIPRSIRRTQPALDGSVAKGTSHSSASTPWSPVLCRGGGGEHGSGRQGSAEEERGPPAPPHTPTRLCLSAFSRCGRLTLALACLWGGAGDPPPFFLPIKKANIPACLELPVQGRDQRHQRMQQGCDLGTEP